MEQERIIVHTDEGKENAVRHYILLFCSSLLLLYSYLLSSMQHEVNWFH